MASYRAVQLLQFDPYLITSVLSKWCCAKSPSC